MKHKILMTLALLITAVTGAWAQEETTWYVDASATGGDGKTPETAFKTLNDALTNSGLQEGNTIMIASGTYTGTNNTGLTINKNKLNFIKYGDGEAIFDGGGQRIWQVGVNTINIYGLTFINGGGDKGGALYFPNDLSNSVINATFINNTANEDGAAVYIGGNADKVKVYGEFINNNGGNSIIYIGNSVSGNSIHDSFFQNNKANKIFSVKVGEITAKDNWFGNWFGSKDLNYYKIPDDVGIDLENWLYLKATADPVELNVGETSAITFKLSSFDGSEHIDYDASKMNVVLELSQTLGELNKNTTLIGKEVIYTAKQEGDASVTGKVGNVEYTIPITVNKTTGPEVTTNAAEEGATFTEASFLMPTYDVDVNYELVRDMSVQMQAQVGDDPAKEPRYRVQWNGERWVPADLNLQQVLALFSLKDLIEDKTLNLTSFNDSIYAVDAEGNPIGDAMTFQNFTFAPGRYCVTVTAPQGIAYEGTTAPSNIFELFQGYEVTVPAGEYATFYKDENLCTDDEDAVLYTIANVTDTEAQLSDAVKIMPKNTPMLIFNKSEQDKTFLLIPTTDDAAEVTPAKEFMGSVSSVELNASSSTADYYALNGKAFVWVKGTINIGANKCWLQIGDQPAAARATTRSITGGGDTTGINAIDSEQLTDDNYYDLNGRKVEKPNRKGIYIHNGRKVVVR